MARREIILTNYSNGEVEISDGSSQPLRLPRERANSLIMSARMHTVDEFLQALPAFIPDAVLLQALQSVFDRPTSTERWNAKEKFARLRTLTSNYPSKVASQEVVEIVHVSC